MFFSCYTLGCKTNQVETDALAEQLTSRGHIRVEWGAYAHALIINTCSVTAVSDRKSRAVISRARRENPNAIVAVHGCMAQALGEKPPHIDILGGTGDRTGFINELERVVGDIMGGTGGHFPLRYEPARAGKTRAFLKIQDGCSNSCAYCIIPSLRGASRSLAFEDILSNARRFVESGAKEIVLTGIEISAYDGGAAQLAVNLAKHFPDTRFRIGSLDPSCVTENFVRTLSIDRGICPHFHLALQSGCSKTLTAMNRKYSAANASEAVKLLRGSFNCTLGCDLIVGFPGETDEDFEESLAFVEDSGFTFMHIFPYSKRPGTAAAEMSGQLSSAVKQERAKKAAALARRLFLKSAEQQDILSVLFETESGGFSTGHADNYFEVRVEETGLHNQVKQVKIKNVCENALIGAVLH